MDLQLEKAIACHPVGFNYNDMCFNDQSLCSTPQWQELLSSLGAGCRSHLFLQSNDFRENNRVVEKGAITNHWSSGRWHGMMDENLFIYTCLSLVGLVCCSSQQWGWVIVWDPSDSIPHGLMGDNSISWIVSVIAANVSEWACLPSLATEAGIWQKIYVTKTWCHFIGFKGAHTVIASVDIITPPIE